jgi:hypothetical protein
MNCQDARAALAAAIQDALAGEKGLTLAWDNAQKVDLARAGDLFLRVEMYWDAAEQIELSHRPHHRTAGSVWFTIFSREDSGTQAALGLADRLTAALSFRNLSGIVTRVLKPGRRENHDGWQSQEWMLPFYFNS